MLAVILEDVIEQETFTGGYMQDTRTYFVRYSTPEWEAACEWVSRHGLDPMLILGASLVTRNAIDHTIIYRELVTNDAGDWIIDSAGEPVTRVRVERGEAGPWPFPSIITEGDPT